MFRNTINILIYHPHKIKSYLLYLSLICSESNMVSGNLIYSSEYFIMYLLLKEEEKGNKRYRFGYHIFLKKKS
jgi:hypothetical protein